MSTEVGRQERRRQATRLKLIDAARKLIAAQGYAATGIRDITDAADVSKGTFYLYFNDKEDLTRALILEGFEDLDAEIAQTLTSEQRVAHVAEGLRAVFHYAAENRDLFRIMLGREAPAELSLLAFNYYAQAIEDIMRLDGVTDKALPFPPVLLAQFTAGACVRLALWWLEDDHGLSPDDISQIAYRLLSQGVLTLLMSETRSVEKKGDDNGGSTL
jgi:AcrR family transcriptional regulator